MWLVSRLLSFLSPNCWMKEVCPGNGGASSSSTKTFLVLSAHDETCERLKNRVLCKKVETNKINFPKQPSFERQFHSLRDIDVGG